MPDADRTAYLATLAPGSNLDLRGTTISEAHLRALLLACTDPSTGHPRFGGAVFQSAVFSGGAHFESAIFSGDAHFEFATFNGDANFRSVVFDKSAWFGSVIFHGDTSFESVTFSSITWFEFANFDREVTFRAAAFSKDVSFKWAAFRGDSWLERINFNGDANFRSAIFDKSAWFEYTTFGGNANFRSAVFSGDVGYRSATFGKGAWFESAIFSRDAGFESAEFDGLQHLGPLMCMGRAGFDEARFAGPQVTIEMAAREASFDRVTFAGSVVVRLRYANVQLTHATLGGPSAIQAWPMPFLVSGGQLPEVGLPGIAHSMGVRLLSLDGVDTAQLVLEDVDLTQCHFTGAFHLDQIQIGFGCAFAGPPSGWRRRSGRLPVRCSARKALAEEHHWRAQVGDSGWRQGPYHGLPGVGAGPEDLAGVYQRLRKAFEEAGNEPDAADFYYGEMEMRRHDRSRPRAERRLLWLYWLASGYGLRASRALSWLVAAMGVTLLAMMLLGLPNDSPNPETTGTYTAGTVKTVTKTPDPSLTLPWRKRVSVDRAEKGALVVVNSVVFRSSGQNLTLPGTVIEMASRIGEPVLLGLAALAVRSRVKR
ncbi:pentapeptide repeat-containing protein [Kitasatospora cineracea]|uniref:pentapeptide repeat-containing protein n=1 Tax=Kitasatospora cineracea TaxID=88074 RepID=UPI0036983568